MRYYDYSFKQLEDKATELLIEFDEDRLHRIKPIDVYAVIEKCLGVDYDWKYLTPDGSVLGATALVMDIFMLGLKVHIGKECGLTKLL